MRELVRSALERARLLDIFEARQKGDYAHVRACVERLKSADLLLVGALADAIREKEVGPLVRVYANTKGDHDGGVLELTSGEPSVELEALRELACMRIAGPHAARIRVSWSELGLELAQVALGFGANELVGPIADKRGLPIADDRTKKVKGAGQVSLQLIKMRELEGLIRRAAREPVFINSRGEIERAEDMIEPSNLETAHADRI